ncbi:hypothetical protein NDU88_001561 [Pleurodeles waltl]|uniref:Uncharacterized protein n=1 Tax=Pleurodeles waltl TaxID=8319 RepID=A0AAV7KTQ5_PLEWA|nr:hypothetical protein NDU88_001561 [Pleurodeles waltl]
MTSKDAHLILTSDKLSSDTTCIPAGLHYIPVIHASVTAADVTRLPCYEQEDKGLQEGHLAVALLSSSPFHAFVFI